MRVACLIYIIKRVFVIMTLSDGVRHDPVAGEPEKSIKIV